MPCRSAFEDAKLTSNSAIHIWRSKLLERASACERELRRIARIPSGKNKPLKCLANEIIEQLADQGNSDRKSKKLTTILGDLVPLIELRSEIAHSQVYSASSENNTFTIFENANASHRHFHKTTVVTKEQQERASQKFADLANRLSQISEIN